MREVWKRLPIRKGEDVVLDFGAGMGRGVIVAVSHPFKAVIGVEISPQRSEIERENLKTSIARHPRKVTVVYTHPGFPSLEQNGFPWLRKFDEFTTGLTPGQTDFFEAKIETS